MRPTASRFKPPCKPAKRYEDKHPCISLAPGMDAEQMPVGTRISALAEWQLRLAAFLHRRFAAFTMNSSQHTLAALAAISGHVSIQHGIATLADGTTLTLGEKQRFDVHVCRTAYAHQTIQIEAFSPQQAAEMAMDTAGNVVFHESSADYSVDMVVESNTGKCVPHAEPAIETLFDSFKASNAYGTQYLRIVKMGGHKLRLSFRDSGPSLATCEVFNPAQLQWNELITTPGSSSANAHEQVFTDLLAVAKSLLPQA